MQVTQEIQVQSLGGKILWRRKWQPTPVSLPGKPQGQRSLVGYSLWSWKKVRNDCTSSRHERFLSRISVYSHSQWWDLLNFLRSLGFDTHFSGNTMERLIPFCKDHTTLERVTLNLLDLWSSKDLTAERARLKKATWGAMPFVRSV